MPDPAYLGDQRHQLNPALLTAPTFTDAGCSGDERVYTVVAVDANAAQSLGRTLSLPLLRAGIGAEARLKRGVMNRLVYTVENRSAAAVAHVRLKVTVGGREHFSEPFAVDAGAAVAVPVTVGGYEGLNDGEVLVTTLEITPHEGETVRIVRRSEIPVDDGALVLQILNDALTRGGAGQVRFALSNTGDAAIEIVTARSAGKAASDEITFYLLDADDNVLSAAAFKQALGGGVLTLANGTTVARIGAGETFTSEPLALPVPANAPDGAVIRLEIAGIVLSHQEPERRSDVSGRSSPLRGDPDGCRLSRRGDRHLTGNFHRRSGGCDQRPRPGVGDRRSHAACAA
ncbi:MAG: hypothetical protein U5J82_15910 [Desulfobacterales bacterium]|nr:hypothetical protein [Desulfobacterales bacterium]